MYNPKRIKSKIFTAILIISLLSIIPSTFSWVYQDGTPEDTKFEMFGPRADKLLVKLYVSSEPVWDALSRGEVDITDPENLTQSMYDFFTNPPANYTFNVIRYGPEPARYKAMCRRYTGGSNGSPVGDGEDQYRNKTWQGTVNIDGQGVDNFWTLLNMHPTGYAYGDGNMTIRYGFSHPDLGYLNPIYASTRSDLRIIDLIYDKLMRRDPYNITEWMPWIVKNFTVGTYFHPVYLENYTKVTIALRTDVTWHDGTPLTTADVYFTLVELKRVLEARGLPLPSWMRNVEHVLTFKIFDPYNFEVLYDVEDDSVLSWIGDTPMLPKHVWKPIVEFGDPTGFAPDPNLIGSGPWRLKEYATNSHILMVTNKPSSTVQTNLPGSVPVHSPYGYFRLYPTDINVRSAGFYTHRVPAGIKSWKFNISLENQIQEVAAFVNISAVDLTNPVSSTWNETWPMKSWPYYITDWLDDNQDGHLSRGDVISLMWDRYAILEWYHVELMLYMPPGPFIMVLQPVVIGIKYLSLDGSLLEEPGPVILKSGIPYEQQWIYLSPATGKHVLKASIHVEQPNWDSWKLNCTWIYYTFTFWVTIREDIAGRTLYDDIGLPSYPYKSQLPSPDAKVDIKDVALVAKAFGSYPGHPRWCPVADISCDYQIDIRDIAMIAKRFGWSG